MAFTLVDRLQSAIKKCPAYYWKWFHKLIFLSFVILSLAFFLHFREVRVDHLECGSVAKKYVVAQVGFDFADLETTRLLSEESLKDIGLIYYFDDEDLVKGEAYIRDELTHNSVWREEFASLTFDQLMQAGDLIRDTLRSVKFTDERTACKLANMGTPFPRFLLCESGGQGERSMESVWQQVEKAAFPTSMTEAVYFMLEKYRAYPWNFKEDFNLRQSLRQQIKEQMPTKMKHVEAGTRIINAGDRVTQRHLDMLQNMKRVLTEEQHLITPLTICGSMAFAAILILIGVIYFYKFHPAILHSFSKMSLMAVVMLLTLSIAKLTEYFIVQQWGHLVDVCRFSLYLLFTSLILSILVDRAVAIIVSGFTAIVFGITLTMDSHGFLIMNLLTAVMGAIWIKGVRKRKEIFVVCSKVWLCTIPMILAFNLLENQLWDRQVLNDCLTTAVFIMAIAVLTVAILPLLESAFGIVTDMTLLESGDSNHPLLRRLSLEAAGTYQHSLSVASLAEEAALAIGASAVLCRVGALFHDIGKTVQPNYFAENVGDGFDMHRLLTPLESAQVIIQHVTEGIKLAENANLPQPLIDIIGEHHGTTLVYYFYHKQMQQRGVKTLGVEEGFFRYPGRIPQTRESAIVMLADSAEASFRCHHVLDEKHILDLVEEVVADKIREHQLSASQLTFNDLDAIKKAFCRSLLAFSHIRTHYPKKPHSSQVSKLQFSTL